MTNSGNALGSLGIRPLSARSVVLSVLLGTHPPVLPASALVALAREFGIADGTVRTALSRMVAAGELSVEGGRYRLTGRLLERQRQQDLGRDDPGDWDGTWWVVNVLTPRRTAAERRAFRTEAVGAKLGELRPEAWLRPANIPLTLDRGDVLVSRGSMSTSVSTSLVAELWDVEDLADTNRALHDALGAVSDDTDLATGFTILAATLRFLRSEPMLPTELADTGPSSALRARYRAVEADLQRRLGSMFRSAGDADPAVSTAGR